jgi:type I site-specific restriction endonuclease
MDSLQTEDDVRTKVVSTWLAAHGFAAQDFVVEPMFTIRLGRQTVAVDSRSEHDQRTFRPRADLLVRHVDGRNLLIIETKGPNEAIDGGAEAQAISYARLLTGGGMPPFAIVTNGRDSAIYDVLSGESLEGAHIPNGHRHARNGFKVTVTDIGFYTEALERFVALSPANLLQFCRQQVRAGLKIQYDCWCAMSADARCTRAR